MGSIFSPMLSLWPSWVKQTVIELDAIIGALTMERWEIKLDPRSGSLDLEGLRRREFTEF